MGDAELRVICGPTAAGKSAVAMWLASRRPCAIVSADSRQVYRGFDIGTAKPTQEERALVPHFGIDVVDPTTRYSAAAWATAAEQWIDESAGAGRTPLVVGGTGLYLRALFGAFFEEPPLDESRRAALQAWLGELPASELARWTARLDPERAHLGRTQLLRAIEVALLSGRRVSALHREHPRPPRRVARYLVVDPGSVLAERIGRRVDEMFARGWLDEVRSLSRSVPADAPAWQSSGYRAVRALSEGVIGEHEAKQRIIVETRQYAKRQRTWFRHQLPADRVTRLDPAAPDWRDRVESWFIGEGNRTG